METERRGDVPAFTRRTPPFRALSASPSMLAQDFCPEQMALHRSMIGHDWQERFIIKETRLMLSYLNKKAKKKKSRNSLFSILF